MTENQKVDKGDFVEVEFTGTTSEGRVFDTTSATIAKKNDFFNPEAEYKPKIICVGQGHILPGIDQQLIGKGLGKDYEITLESSLAFGKKSAKLLKLVPLSVFKKQKVEPVMGLQIMMDNSLGTVRRATGGRIIVDFNHPLAGKDVNYTIKINKIITNGAEKLKALVLLEFGAGVEAEFKEGIANLKTKQKLPEEILAPIEKHIKELIPEITKVKLTV